jgi:hypothetical protein
MTWGVTAEAIRCCRSYKRIVDAGLIFAAGAAKRTGPSRNFPINIYKDTTADARSRLFKSRTSIIRLTNVIHRIQIRDRFGRYLANRLSLHIYLAAG